MNRRHHCAPRSGFTLLELLVVISIIAVLMSLILPAIQSARASARNLQCKNRLRNLSIAMLGRAETHAGQLPAIGCLINYPGTDDLTGMHSWVVELLPFIDRADLHDRWDYDSTWFMPGNIELGQTYLEVLACPDDRSAQKPGGLSYVVNNGYDDGLNDPDDTPAFGIHGATAEVFDWDGDGNRNGPEDENLDRDPGDTDIHIETGVFWAHYVWFRGKRNHSLSRRLSEIYDGTTNTIMMTENLKAGSGFDRFYPGPLTSWSNPGGNNCGFIYNLDPTSGPADFDEPKANERYPSEINTNKNSREGTAPYPSSNHPGGVNIALCDGSVRFLSEDVDSVVYPKLISSGGDRLRGIDGFESQSPVGTDW